jgi:hypothetical protein
MSRPPPSRRASPLPPRSFAGSYNNGGGGFPSNVPPPPFPQGPPGPGGPLPPTHSGFLEAPPRPRPSKRLILCEDGTWQTSDGNIAQKRRTSKIAGGITAAQAVPSNVVRLARAIRPVSRDGIPQVVNYHVGVGVGGGVVDKVYGGVSGEGVCFPFPLHFLSFFRFARGGWISGISIRRSWTEWIMIDMGRASFFLLNQ